MMKLHDSADRLEAVTRLRGLEGKVPDLLSIEVLEDSLGRTGAADLVLISTHADTDGLTGYLEHPDHEDVAAWLRPRLVSRSVVDSAR